LKQTECHLLGTRATVAPRAGAWIETPYATITGVGCKIGIIDDLIRNSNEAYNERILEEHWNFYNNTYTSRLESGAREIVVMTRWNVNDLCGKLLDSDPDNWYLIKMPAMKEDGTMLCEDILDKDTYLKRKNAPGTDPIIFAANYDQNTIEFSDRLYGDFKTYDEVQEHYERIEAYIDTADEGSDFLAGFVVGVHEGIVAPLDLIYTQEPMEITEPAVAKMLTSTDCDRAWIESNNGGRGFARNVERLLRSSGNTKTRIEWFHQNENKMARILSNATSVASSIRFPAQWHSAWPQLYSELMFASRTRKMLHDDAEDALTGIVEKVLNGTNKRFVVW
jgi:predicted phage terminase large subunit-like protein